MTASRAGGAAAAQAGPGYSPGLPLRRTRFPESTPPWWRAS